MSIRNKFLSTAVIFSLFLNFGFAQESGLASYYGDAFHGSQTANGEIYDRTKMTAAHRTHKFGTYLKVTRKDNKKSVVVKVNDRGPHIKGRIVDVSKEAAKKLGLINDGVAEVTVEKVSGKSSSNPAPKVAEAKVIPSEAVKSGGDLDAEKAEADRIAREIADNNRKEREAAAKRKAEADAKAKKATAAAKAAKKEDQPVELKEAKMVSLKNYSEYGLYKIQVMRPEKKGFGVQVASINNHENMLKQIAHFQGKHFKNILTSIEKGADGNTVYKIILGPFPDQKTAQSYKRSLSKKHKVNGFVVSLEEGK